MTKQTHAMIIPPDPLLKQDIQKLSKPLLAQLDSLEVTDAPSFALADALLSRITAARDLIKARMKKLLDPAKEAADKAKESLQEIKLLHADFDNPLAEADGHVRGLMAHYKYHERLQLQAAQAEKDEAQAKLAKEAQVKQAQIDKAKTEKQRERLEAEKLAIEVKADVAKAAPQVEQVRAEGSTTRVTIQVEVTNLMELCAGIAKGEIPSECVTPNLMALRQCARAGMAKDWNGIKISEEVTIVRR